MGRFSRLLRTSLESSREDYILLEDEINSLKNYMELQSLRYDNKFDYTVEIDKTIDLESAIIPPMLLQPFIENAIEHGIRHKEDKGSIVVRFIRDGEKMSCEIEDDGIGREKTRKIVKQKEHKSLATDIIRDRMAVLNKKLRQKISLSIIDLKSDTDQALGTLVRLDLPYLLD
jgi:LytS/YehU family sensor histidine kinase